MPKRKRYTAALKAQVVLELLKEEKTASQIGSEYGVHPNQLRRWRQAAIDNLPRLFADDEKDRALQEAEHERKLEQLYAQIGRLTTQLGWLKKKAGVDNLPG